MEAYRIYSDGDIPNWGVQAVIFLFDDKWDIVSGANYYILLDNGRWIGVDRDGVEDYILNKLDSVRRVCAGRTLDRDKFGEFYQRAKLDRAYANENGFLPPLN